MDYYEPDLNLVIEWDESYHDRQKEKDFKEDYPSYYDIYEKAKANDWHIYMGYADDIDDPILCEMSMNYEDDELIIDKEGGY